MCVCVLLYEYIYIFVCIIIWIYIYVCVYYYMCACNNEDTWLPYFASKLVENMEDIMSPCYWEQSVHYKQMVKTTPCVCVCMCVQYTGFKFAFSNINNKNKSIASIQCIDYNVSTTMYRDVIYWQILTHIDNKK